MAKTLPGPTWVNVLLVTKWGPHLEMRLLAGWKAKKMFNIDVIGFPKLIFFKLHRCEKSSSGDR